MLLTSSPLFIVKAASVFSWQPCVGHYTGGGHLWEKLKLTLILIEVITQCDSATESKQYWPEVGIFSKQPWILGNQVLDGSNFVFLFSFSV
jgi:hypothetical protein